MKHEQMSGGHRAVNAGCAKTTLRRAQGGVLSGIRGPSYFASRLLGLGLAIIFSLSACSNDPYPPEDGEAKVLYSSFDAAPRTLDPATAYTTKAHSVTGVVYDTLLKYHFLKRPLELMPGLAVDLPLVTPLEGGRTRYRFTLREDLLFADDDCFELSGEGRRTREIVSADIAFQLMRLADPLIGSPVAETFANIDGFVEFAATLEAHREEDPTFADQAAHEQYEAAGGVRGIEMPSRYVLDITLHRAYPQIKYWFAMEFTTPVPWEAIAYYTGQDGRPRFDDHPVGAGPFVLSEYDKQSRYVLSKNPNWYGVRHPEWKAPAAIFPTEGDEEDRRSGRMAYAGRSLPLIDRVVVVREKESIPRFNKFLQGYYDASGVIKESFDSVIQGDGLSVEMEGLGMRLGKAVSPDVYYIGFNMNDEVVGRSNGESSRKIRQAMSLAVDSEEFLRIFQNGRGVPAQSPLPPGIYGYESGYENTFRQPNIERAKELMTEAGYQNGIDPTTGEALTLTFDTSSTSTAGLNQVRFYTNAWRQLGIDVQIDGTTYNQFQEKLRQGDYQIFQFGWVADYPDPENFLFLLWSKMGKSDFGGPNATNFSDARFDELFVSMKARDNGPQRIAEIEEMLSILERERPWIELFHREDYSLYQGWVKNVKPMGLSIPTYQYRDIDPIDRSEKRKAWNEPVQWPAYVLLLAGVMVIVPGVLTYFKERQ